MMQIRAILLILTLLLAVVEAQPNFILNIITYLFSPLLNWLISSTCEAIFDNFDDGFQFGCRCRGVYDDPFGGIGGRITCQIDDPFCLINRPFKIYCGEVKVSASFNTRTGISNVKGCIDITSDFPRDFPIPIDDVSQFPKACVSAVPSTVDFLTFESCEITFDKEVCKSCVVCESKRDFLFDCRNINLNPAQNVDPTFVEGPYVTECVGFSFLFGSTTDQPTLAPGRPTVPPFFAPITVPTAPTIPVVITVAPIPNVTPVNAPIPAASPVNTTAPVPAASPFNNTAPVPVASPVNNTAPIPVATPANNTAPVTSPVNNAAPAPVASPINNTAPVSVAPPVNNTAPVP